jgi:membrane fusion protein (multidrug efflux system)
MPANSPRREWKRPLLFALLPLALVAGGYFYVTGGQIMSTDNAYVQADVVGVSTDVPGTVVAIEVRDNQAVSKGQVLYRLKPDTFQIALDGAKAQLGTVHDQVMTLQASYKLALAQVEQAQADLAFYQTAFKRQQDLLATGAGTKAAFDSAEHDLDATRQRIAVAKAQAEASLAQLGGDPDQKIEKNSFYLQAKSGLDNAQRDLDDTVVRAPFDGIVTNVNAIQIGSYLQTSQQAFSLVSTTHM